MLGHKTLCNMEKPKRTNTQNRSMHKLYSMMADEFNTKGLEMKTILKPEYKLWWTDVSVKEHLWKPVMKAMYNIDSTTELTTDQVSKVYEQIMKVIGEKFGVYLEFPSKEQLDDYWKDYK